jgi:hypothetical protein
MFTKVAQVTVESADRRELTFTLWLPEGAKWLNTIDGGDRLISIYCPDDSFRLTVNPSGHWVATGYQVDELFGELLVTARDAWIDREGTPCRGTVFNGGKILEVVWED